MSSLTHVKAVAFVERDNLGVALVAAAGAVARDSLPPVVRVGLEACPAPFGRASSGGQSGRRSEGRSWEVRAPFGAVCLVGSCPVGGRVRGRARRRWEGIHLCRCPRMGNLADPIGQSDAIWSCACWTAACASPTSRRASTSVGFSMSSG